jgi:hypothetical protein
MDYSINSIFIGGTMRSGTSLSRAIIGSHSKIAIYPRDLPLWPYFFNKYGSTPIKSLNVWKKIVRDVLTHKKAGYISETLEERLINSYQPEKSNVPGLIQTFLEDYAEKIEKPIWGHKTPNNEVFVDEIFEAFPNAKFIHVIRDPRAVEASRNKRSSFLGDEPFYHLQVWKQSFELAQRNLEKYPKKYMNIKYEDLLINTEQVVKSICKFLEVEFEEKMLEFQGLEDWGSANTSFEKVDAGAINLAAIVRFKTTLSKKRICMYENYLHSEMKELGYELMYPKLNSFLVNWYKAQFVLDPRRLKSLFRKKENGILFNRKE